MQNLKLILIPLALLVSHPLWSQTKEMGPRDYPTQSCTAAPATGYLRQCADTVTGNLICVNSSGGSCSPAGTGGGGAIATGVLALPVTAIAANTCGTAVTAAASGALTTDAVAWSFNGDPTASVGYGGAGSIVVRVWTTANTVNAKLCNITAASVTPGAQAINWSISHLSSGSPTLTGVLTMPTGTQNLTPLGTTDWAHWGLGSAAGFDHKASGGMQISNYTQLGTGPVNDATNLSVGFSWTDGTPTASATSSTTGLFVANCVVGNGFRITAPAGTTPHTLAVYIGVYGSRGQMVAHLSDSSAADYTDTGLNDPSPGTTGAVAGLYTLTYQAGSAAQTLTVSYTINACNVGTGNVTLSAAALQ